MTAAPAARSTELVLGEGLHLPLEAVTETFAIIANRGGGKSSTGRVLAEELHSVGSPVVVLDPKGDWHGIRSSTDGKHAGLPFVILGGDHGDIPLHPDAGELVADTLVAARASAVLDLSALSKTKARTFATAFAERLYRANREPLHLIVDEGDILIPQRAAADTMRLLGAMEDLAKRGRHRGLGMTVISQRPADVSKSVLDLMETLIVLRVTGPKTRKAIMDWVDDHTDDGQQTRELLASLKTLPVGQGWVWSPGWLGDLRRATIRPISTLDTHATPQAGVTATPVTTRAEVDIDALGEQMTQLRDQAAHNDPVGLHRRIRELEQQLTAATTAPPVRVDVPVPARDPATHQQVLALRTTLTNALDQVEQVLAQLDALPDAATVADTQQTAAHSPSPQWPAQHAPSADTTAGLARSGDGNGAPLPKAQRKVLEVLATHGERDVSAVAVLAGYAANGGGFRNALSALRTAGLIDGHGTLRITDAGRERLGPVPPLPRGAQLLEYWKSQKAIAAAGRAILDALSSAHPQPLTVEEVAARTGYAASGGGYRNALSRLRTLNLISGRGQLHLNDDLTG